MDEKTLNLLKMTKGTNEKLSVLAEVLKERNRQDEKWGQQNHPDKIKDAYDESDLSNEKKNYAFDKWISAFGSCLSEKDVKLAVNSDAENGLSSWEGILTEEYAEVVDADDSELDEELIQLAAVAVAWVEARRRRKNED